MKQQILIIDDSEKMHPLIRAILAKEPVEIRSATDPSAGLMLAASICPDLILLDVDMPGMDGFEVCRQLKANPATARFPIIFLTSHSAVKEKLLGFGLGAADYVTKPFNHAELLARVRASLRNNQVIRALEETALIDPLTGLGNRVMFVQRIAAEICLRVRSGNPLSITLIDVDQFDKIKETYGPHASDQVLAVIGKILFESYRLEDIACHFGDGEFGIIAPNTAGTDAVGFAERIREIIAHKLIEPEKDPLSVLARESLCVTASFGVAQAEASYDRSMIQRANEALYRAKQNGCNQVAVASKEVEDQSAAA